MPGGKRLWRTEGGDLVEDGHPDAVTLAYGEDDELDTEVEKTAAKQDAPARNKKAAAPTNKSAG